VNPVIPWLGVRKVGDEVEVGFFILILLAALFPLPFVLLTDHPLLL
jgi:hypothetical protein